MSFSSALSGLNAAQKVLDVTSNNIANNDTIGFKKSSTVFGDVYAASEFGAASNAVGAGVKLGGVIQDFSQGSVSFTDNSLDLAINGGGFFFLKDNGSPVYTRAGAFHLNKAGFLVNEQGHTVQGQNAEGDGTIAGASTAIQVSTANVSPEATTSVSLGVNLNAASEPITNSWTSGQNPPDTDEYNNVTSNVIYDSLGVPHVMSYYMIASDTIENTFYVAFQMDGVDIPTVGGYAGYDAATNTEKLFSVTFNEDGSFSHVTKPTDYSNYTQGATENALEAAVDTAITDNEVLLQYNPPQVGGSQANVLTMAFDFTAFTQFGSPFAVESSSQNGFTTGRLDNLTVDSSGILFGSYTNGQSKPLAQIQMANFPNKNGLQPQSNTQWVQTFSSGTALISNPGTSSMGLIQSGALEGTNVDLTDELVTLIEAQRNYQANAKSIQTEDTTTQTLINI